jgi:hypothetical protein
MVPKPPAQSNQQGIADKTHGANHKYVLTNQALAQHKRVLGADGDYQCTAQGQTFQDRHQIQRHTPYNNSGAR